MGTVIIAILPMLLGLQTPAPQDNLQKERATLLRSALKPHGAFQGIDPEGRLRLLVEGDKEAKAWPVDPDAEIRINGYWGGIEDLVQGERLWVWARVGSDGKPRAVIMIADELSEQDIHQIPYTLTAVDPAGKTVVVRRKLDGKTEQSRTLALPASWSASQEGRDVLFRSASGETLIRASLDSIVYIQTAGDSLLRLAGAADLAAAKEAQKKRLEEQWRTLGLPGTVTGLHLLSGEIEVTMDHEGIRWARSLKPSDRVTLQLEKPLKAMVSDVRPWYERTRLTLVSNGRDLADVALGRRLRIGVSEPAAELLASRMPPDSDRPREAAARVEWMLASTYCSCTIAGDVCTGMFYTLAACNTMTCGMPERVRKFVRPLIEKGLGDKEIFEKMEAEFGASLWKPHLLR